MSPLTNNDPPTLILKLPGALADLQCKPIQRDLVTISLAWFATVSAVYLMAYGGFIMLIGALIVCFMWSVEWRQRFPKATWTIFLIVYGLFTVAVQQLVTAGNPGWIIFAPIAVLLQLYCNWGLARAKYAGGN